MEVRFYYITSDGDREEITEEQVLNYWKNRAINGKWYMVAEATCETYCPECGRPMGAACTERIVDQEMIDRIRISIASRKEFMKMFNW